MIAANNLVEVFDYLCPLVSAKIGNEGWQVIVDKQNSTGNTPLRIEYVNKTTLW